MAIDIYNSRRTKHIECRFWTRDESISAGDLTKWVLENKPKGIFYAQEISARSLQEQQIHNVFEFNSNTTTLFTSDIVDELEVNNIVLYLGHLWNVLNVQREIHNKNLQFGEIEYNTYITLKR